MKKQTLSAIIGAISAATILAAAVLQLLAFFLSYDAQIYYFQVGAPLPLAAAICAIVGGALGVAFATLSPRDLKTPFSGNFPAAAPAALTSILAAATMVAAPGILAKLSAVFLFFSTFYFLLSAFSIFKLSDSFVALLGFCPIIACALLNAYYYFDASVEMNAPIKILLQTALLFAMLYFTGEVRFLLGRQHPKLYLVLAFCTVASAALTLAFPILFFLGLLPRLDYALGAALSCGIAATVICRVICLIRPKHPLPEEEIPEGSEETPDAEASDAIPDAIEQEEGETE